MEDTYTIYRFYRNGGKPRIQRRNLTLKQAQEHCSDPATRKEGKWFDGYQKN